MRTTVVLSVAIPALLLVGALMVAAEGPSATADGSGDVRFPVEVEYVTTVPTSTDPEPGTDVRRFIWRAASWEEWTNEQVEGPEPTCTVAWPDGGLLMVNGNCADGWAVGGPSGEGQPVPSVNPWLFRGSGHDVEGADGFGPADDEVRQEVQEAAESLGLDVEAVDGTADGAERTCGSLGYLQCADPAVRADHVTVRVSSSEHGILLHEHERFGDVNLATFEVTRILPLDSYSPGRQRDG